MPSNSPTDNELEQMAIATARKMGWSCPEVNQVAEVAVILAAIKGVRDSGQARIAQLEAVLREIAEAEAPPVCRRCNGSRAVRVKHGRTFDGDSAAECADAWHAERCPDCAQATQPHQEAAPQK